MMPAIPKLRRKAMRTRHQDGWVEERGNRTKIWYGHYYVYLRDESGSETRHHRGVNLGEKSKLRKWEAVDKLKGIIKAAQQNQPAPSEMTLGWFVRERFVPMRSGRWRPSTKATNTNNIEQQIMPALSEVPLAEMDKFKCQTFLNSLAEQGYSFSVVDRCRIMLKAILEEAVEAELIGKNPARHLTNPETKEPYKPVLAKETVRVLLNALPFREKLIGMIAAFCAMRPGEIFGLKRSSYRGNHFFVEGTAWRGTMQPGKAKTKASKTSIAIPDVLGPMLDEWLQLSPQASPDDLLFPSARPGIPLWPHRWLQSHVQPIARSLGITSKINFQILRRTFATNAQSFGSAKDVQTHLRHSHITTTMDVYTQPVAYSVRRVVNAVADDVMGMVPVRLQRVQ